VNFQEMIGTLNAYWGERGAVIMQPYHTELGAGTSNPATFLRVLDPSLPEWRTAYVEPVIRPQDGRYGENPFRFQHYFQYQVILKPAPDDVLDQYFGSLEALGIDLLKHDIRLVEDDWEQPTLGAWGLGWEVWCDAMEVTQFTYFQQLGGIDLEVIPAEMTYGLERLGLFLQGKKSSLELEWAPGVSWGDVYRESERQWSQYNYEEAPVDVLQRRFDEHEAEAEELLEKNLPLPAYDQVLKSSHAFNLLDARGAVSVTERAAYIGRVRKLARRFAQLYVGDDGDRPD
jgi:tetrameric-type glycyl-tRNA synthetase alpha subunit